MTDDFHAPSRDSFLGMPDIRHMIPIKASPEIVYPLVSTPAGLGKWWAEDVFNVSDDACSLGFFNRGTVYTLRIESKTPSVEVVWRSETGAEWAGTRLIFDLQTGPHSTILRFTHADWAADTDYLTSCNTTWGELMFRLMAVAEGKNPGPLFLKSSFAY
jgi:uncharacterized protein YndB with AHSA1/START domain